MQAATKERSNDLAAAALLAAFALWTALVQSVDVQPVGQNGTDIGFATFNTWFHSLLVVKCLVVYRRDARTRQR